MRQSNKRKPYITNFADFLVFLESYSDEGKQYNSDGDDDKDVDC